MDYVEAIGVLGVASGSSMDTIHSAYRSKVKIYHTDVNEGGQYAEEKIRELNIAYNLLRSNKVVKSRSSEPVKTETNNMIQISIKKFGEILYGNSYTYADASSGRPRVLDRKSVFDGGVCFYVDFNIKYEVDKQTQAGTISRLLKVKGTQYRTTLYIPIGYETDTVRVEIDISGIKKVIAVLGMNPVEINTDLGFIQMTLRVERCNSD